MPTTVKAVSVRAFELFTPGGESLGLFKFESKWQGMQQLVSIDAESHSVIVDYPFATLAEVFSEIAGEAVELQVVKASPDVLVKLR